MSGCKRLFLISSLKKFTYNLCITLIFPFFPFPTFLWEWNCLCSSLLSNFFCEFLLCCLSHLKTKGNCTIMSVFIVCCFQCVYSYQISMRSQLLILVNACRIAVFKDSSTGNLFQKNLLDRTDKKDPFYSHCLLNSHIIRSSQCIRNHYHNSIQYL